MKGYKMARGYKKSDIERLRRRSQIEELSVKLDRAFKNSDVTEIAEAIVDANDDLKDEIIENVEEALSESEVELPTEEIEAIIDEKLDEFSEELAESVAGELAEELEDKPSDDEGLENVVEGEAGEAAHEEANDNDEEDDDNEVVELTEDELRKATSEIVEEAIIRFAHESGIDIFKDNVDAEREAHRSEIMELLNKTRQEIAARSPKRSGIANNYGEVIY